MRNPRHQNATGGLTIVIKLGTSSILHETTLVPRLATLSALAETVCDLKARGHRVVIVSSAAIGMGLRRMELKKRPKVLAEKQALAAIGQGRLIALWDNLFSQLDQTVAQILLTRSDISDRSKYLNATKTLTALLDMGVVPIVNENDTVSVSEIKFGDNDTLSAITAGMIAADYLFLMTDVDCLYTENPRKSSNARQVRVVKDIEGVRKLVSTATLGSSLGTGGMETKLIAAELATGAGVATVITLGSKPRNIFSIIQSSPGSFTPSSTDQDQDSESPAILSPAHQHPSTSTSSSSTNPPPLSQSLPNLLDLTTTTTTTIPVHTLFLPKPSPLADRKWWVLHGLTPRGSVVIDEGAYRAISRGSEKEREGEGGNGGRLLAAGVVRVEGSFAAGQAVRIVVRRMTGTGTGTGHGGRGVGSEAGGPHRRLTSVVGGSGGGGGGVEGIEEWTPESTRPTTPVRRPSSSSPPAPLTTATTMGRTQSHEGVERVVRTDVPAESVQVGATATATADKDEVVEELLEVGRGLTNYNWQEIQLVKGLKSSEIERVLGYIESEHVVESITISRSA